MPPTKRLKSGSHQQQQVTVSKGHTFVDVLCTIIITTVYKPTVAVKAASRTASSVVMPTAVSCTPALSLPLPLPLPSPQSTPAHQSAGASEGGVSSNLI